MLLKIMLFFFVITICASACYFFLTSFLQRKSFRFTLITFLLSLAVYVSLFFVRPVSVYLSDTFMLFSAASFCVLIGRGIKTVPSIVSFSIAGSIADIVSFNWGPTHYFMKAAEQLNPASLLNLMAFSIVFKGSICPIVGLGDFIFIGIYWYNDRHPRYHCCGRCQYRNNTECTLCYDLVVLCRVQTISA